MFCILQIWIDDLIAEQRTASLTVLVEIQTPVLRCALMLACRVMCHYALQEKSYAIYDTNKKGFFIFK